MKRVVLLSVIITIGNSGLAYGGDNFAIAMPKQIWEILDDSIPVMDKPETYSNMKEFLPHVVTIIGNGTRVGILESKGWLSPWKKVVVYDEEGKGYAVGWILAEVVKDAKDISYKYK